MTISALVFPRRRGVLGSIFAGYVPLASKSPYPIIVYSVANYQPHLSHFSGNVNIAIPRNFSSFLIPQIPTCQNFLTLKIPKMCYPILETLLKMQPHYSQFSHEYVTPFTGTSPLASITRKYPSLLPPAPRWDCS